MDKLRYKYISDFLNKVCGEIKYKDAHVIISIIVIELAATPMFLTRPKINHLYCRYLVSSIVPIFSLQALARLS